MELYKTAAAVLEKFENKRGSVKSLVFAAGYKNVRQLYALVCESLKYQSVLASIFRGSHSLQQEESLQGEGHHLATVLLYEHLLGKGLGRAGPIRKCIVKNKKEIQHQCQELLEKRGVASLADLLSTQCQTLNKLPIPRYVRVNLLKTTVQDVIDLFTQEGWEFRGPLSQEGFKQDVEGLGEAGFGSDPLMSDVLVFPPGTDLHDHPWVVGGCLVLQDRASCFPAHVLEVPEGRVVLDCCAAPGNKTSHTASLMANTGQIWAFERDGKRMSLLHHQLRRMGVTVAKCMHQDFLATDPGDPRFQHVEYVLVDPSCSGSGIMSRMDHISNTTTTNNNNNSNNNCERLQSLQRFQISILKHALKFPRVKRLVYSTCSIHQEENEQVVSEVLQQVRGKFQLKHVFPQFPHRGLGQGDVPERCLRMSPEHDLTNGFFVACFERVCRDDDDDNNADDGNDDADDDNVDHGGDDDDEETENGFKVNGESVFDRKLKEGGSLSLKKNRKRKRAQESSGGDETVDSLSDGCETNDASSREQNSTTEESDTLLSKKSRKRKRIEESFQQEDTMQEASSASAPGPNTDQKKDQEETLSESPKKKKKKKKTKKKTEKEVMKNESEHAVEDGEDIHQHPKHKKSSKKAGRDEDASSSVVRDSLPSCNEDANTPVPHDNSSAKKKKKKKTKRDTSSSGEDHSSQSQHLDLSTLSPVLGTEGKSTTKKKQKKKRKHKDKQA